MHGKHTNWLNQNYKNSPADSIIFIKDGSNCGTFFYINVSSKIATTCNYIYTNQCNIYYLLSFYSKYYKTYITTGSAIPHIYKKDIINEIIKYHDNRNEQIKIANFLSLLDKQIDLYIIKLELMNIHHMKY